MKGNFLFCRRCLLINKDFKDLNLNSSFLFAAVFENPDNCRIMLELLLGKHIDNLSVKSEHPLLISTDVKCIRLDVHATDSYDVNYDIEAQNFYEDDLAKRSRYYQAELDVASLKPGDSYDKLGDSFIIFICTFDPFGRGLCRYTYEASCSEDGEKLGDGAKRIFFNTKGKDVESLSAELREFFGYFENTNDAYVSTVNNPLIHKLHKEVTKLKKSRELEAGYMKFEELLNRTSEKAKREGKIEGKIEDILRILCRLGDIPEDVTCSIKHENNSEILDKWFDIAIESKNVDEFIKKFKSLNSKDYGAYKL
ncbi:MAG: Rpn family recombination-promoting nuclease/putative transposase [Lachnospiraceae bacterium]|nr:Rpn family recombination-promoting nuclease/putative transposase [Lachnospiraceae bacterium]